MVRARFTVVGVVGLLVTGGLIAWRPSRASVAPVATTFYSCKSVDVSVYAGRIHVRCDKPAAGKYAFFALSTANSAHAARMLSVLMTAHLAGKKIEVEYDPTDTSGTAFGCGANDCRRLLSVGVQ